MSVALTGPALLRRVRRENATLRLATALAVTFGCLGVLLMYGPVAWLALMSVSERPLTG